MPVYNFKALPTVPTASDLLDVVLSKTQRSTPTVVRGKWQISRIRQFYMVRTCPPGLSPFPAFTLPSFRTVRRPPASPSPSCATRPNSLSLSLFFPLLSQRKVKYTQQTFHDKLGNVLDSFPKLDDIHPFYSDLMNVLYDRDHYKLALGQIHTAVGLIDKIAKDYVRLLKYGDSLYRCKQLKKAALGRMCTLMKKQKASLVYLEQVRQHMSRLPSIDPNTRTLLVCGYPNVGKSSFMNTVTRADVEVEPYAFTTKSLYVGHMDYKYLRWQVIDTPGILDRPLETRNTIEMQSITALAHLRAVVLYIVDISEQCGYTIAQQAALFHSIKPLFANKPLMVVCNKTDVQAMDSLPAESRKLLDEMKEAADLSGAGATAGMVVGSAGTDEGGHVTMSTLKEEGVSDVKNKACEMLLASRVDQKLKTRKTNDILNRLHVALPSRGVRAPHIPKSVLDNASKGYPKSTRKTEKDLQEENGGAGVYSMDVRKNYLLEKEEWKYDKIPEIYDGHNVADFVDPDIEERLAELEREEEQMLREEENAMESGSEDDLTAEERRDLEKIRTKKSQIIAKHRKKKAKGQGQAHISRKHDTERRATSRRMRDELGELGVDASAAIERNRGRSVTRRGKKRALEEDGEEGRSKSRSKSRSAVMGRTHSSKSRSRSRGPSVSHTAEKGAGFKTSAQKMKAQIISDKMQRKMQKLARKGEGDRIIPNEMPKHLFSGKRGIGKTDRR